MVLAHAAKPLRITKAETQCIERSDIKIRSVCKSPDTHYDHQTLQSDLAEGAKAGSFVAAPQGLFPAPLPPGRQGSRLLPRFTLLGRAAAKALQDGRMLDVPLSYTFYRCSAF